MLPADQLRFALRDRINGVEVTPMQVPLALLGEFHRDVSDFLRGSGRDVDPSMVYIAIEHGSLAFVASGLGAANSLWQDVAKLSNPNVLSLIDARRAMVLERWQSLARQFPNRTYGVLHASGEPALHIDFASHFDREEDIWVHVEKYMHGKIVDWGGKTKANVHLELENGKTLTVESSQYLIAQESQNLVYRLALLHITAEENLQTGELRHMRLVSIQHHYPFYDSFALGELVQRGTQAWQSIEAPNHWLESLRGNA